MVTVCQTCGVSGYAELLVFCNNCQTSAEHRYCLDKLPGQHEVISWFCEQCKPRPSMAKPNQRGTMGHLKCQFKQTKRSASMQNIGKRLENNAGLFRSSPMRFEKHSKNKRRRLILQEDESAEATKEKLLEVKMPENLSKPRGGLILGKGHLDEEVHANSTCQKCPVKNSCQVLALSQVQKEKTRQNAFLPFDLSVQLLVCPVWRGCFDVCNEEFGSLKACMSMKACEKVCNIVTKLPPMLQMAKLSRNEWPTSFNNSPPNDDSIALCFFSENSNAGEALNDLLDRITIKDFALRVVLDESEMLVFSSIILPEYCQKFEERYYLWGAFRSRQDNSGSCAPTNNCLDSHKKITTRHFPSGFRHATEQCDNAEKIKTRHFPPGFRHATEQCDNAEMIKTRHFPSQFRHATEQCDNAENCNVVEQLDDKSKNSKNRDCSESASSQNRVNIDINLHHHPVQICSKPTADEKSNLEHVSDSKRREYNGIACSKSQVIHSNMHHSDVPICSHPAAEGISRNRNFEHASDSKRPEYNGSACSKSQVDINSNMHPRPVQICPNPYTEGRTSGNRIIDHASDSKRQDAENQIDINSNMHCLPVQICPNPAAEERASGTWNFDLPICSHPAAEGISRNRNFEHASDSKRPEYNGSACSKSQVDINSNMHPSPVQICPNPCTEGRTSGNRIIDHASDSKKQDAENQININSNMHCLPVQICLNPPAEESASGTRNFDLPICSHPAAEGISRNRNFEHASDSKRPEYNGSACSKSQVDINSNMYPSPVQICPNPCTEGRTSGNRIIDHASDSKKQDAENQININSNMHCLPVQICPNPAAEERASGTRNFDLPICSHPAAEGISRKRNFEHASDSKRPEYNGSACSKSQVDINSNMHPSPVQICPNPCTEGRTSGNRIIDHASDSNKQDAENQININSNTHCLPVQICPNPPAEERASGNRNYKHASDSKRQNCDASACSKSQVNIRPNIHHQASPIYTNPTAEERMSQNRNFEHPSDSKRPEYNGSACSESPVNVNSNIHYHPEQVCHNPSAEQSTPQNMNFAHASYSKRRDNCRSLCPESQVRINSNMHYHQVQICPNPTTEERMFQNRNIDCACENCYDRITDDCRTVKQQLANNSNSLEERVVQCLDGNPFCEISDDSSNEITKERKMPMLDFFEYQGKHDQPNNAMHKHPSSGKMSQQGKELLNPRMTKNPVACILDGHKLLGFNYLDWLRNLKIVLGFEKLTYVLEHSPPVGVNDDATEEEKITLQKWRDDDLKTKYYMIASMSDELQKQYNNMSHAYEIHAHLDKLYGAKSRISRYQILRDLLRTRMTEGSSVHDHVLKMINMVEKLEYLGIDMDNILYIDLILQSLPESFNQFITNFLKNRIEISLRELPNMLRNAELTIKKKAFDTQKGSSKPKDSEESFQKKKSPKTKKATCFHCGKLGHLKRNCKQLLTKLNNEKSRFR